MFTLLRQVGLRAVLFKESPALIISMVIAEMFYKFHSFTLECLAFLGTWYGASFVLSALSGQCRGSVVKQLLPGERRANRRAIADLVLPARRPWDVVTGLIATVLLHFSAIDSWIPESVKFRGQSQSCGLESEQKTWGLTR
jgi:hypothetical protein